MKVKKFSFPVCYYFIKMFHSVMDFKPTKLINGNRALNYYVSRETI